VTLNGIRPFILILPLLLLLLLLLLLYYRRRRHHHPSRLYNGYSYSFSESCLKFHERVLQSTKKFAVTMAPTVRTAFFQV
jgi:hypothetical protein